MAAHEHTETAMTLIIRHATLEEIAPLYQRIPEFGG
jgi:hypothetical protein